MKTTTPDPIVAEVRATRDKHAARFGYNIELIFRDIQAQQQSSGRTYVKLPARRVEATTTSTETSDAG